jgi:hypothetical protein
MCFFINVLIIKNWRFATISWLISQTKSSNFFTARFYIAYNRSEGFKIVILFHAFRGPDFPLLDARISCLEVYFARFSATIKEKTEKK